MLEAITTLSVYTIIFWALGSLAWLLTKWLGVDEVVDEMENAHRCRQHLWAVAKGKNER